jgi:hypothetical protein
VVKHGGTQVVAWPNTLDVSVASKNQALLSEAQVTNERATIVTYSTESAMRFREETDKRIATVESGLFVYRP